MTQKRVFVPPTRIEDGLARISGEELHHLARVRRVRVGERVELFDGCGRGYAGTVESVDRHEALIRVEQELPAGSESGCRIHLFQGFPSTKGTFEEILSRVTELGVTRISPLIAGRSRGAVLPDPERLKSLLPRWEKIVRDACKSSGRTVIPRIDPPHPFDSALFEDEISNLRFIALEHGSHPSLRSCLEQTPRRDPDTVEPAQSAPNPCRVLLLIGPEGGWTGEEAVLAAEQGFQGVTLGPRILKTATAAIAAITLVQTFLGDMG